MALIKSYMLLATITIWYKLQKKNENAGVYFLPVPILLSLMFLGVI